MKMRILLEEDGKRTYIASSGSRAHPVMEMVSGVPLENRAAEKARLLALVQERMEQGSIPGLGD